ncbi:MAG: NAD(+) synthase [Coprobacillus sp.]|nr:NAD(+) synthase [Coprobacillus sp.]
MSRVIMAKIIPIKDLRDTNKISEECHSSDEPLFVTKNGYADLVVLSNNLYEELLHQKPSSREELHFTNSNPINMSLDPEFMGFVKVGAASLNVKVGDVNHHVEEIKKYVRIAVEQGVKVLVFPELCITGYTCGDLFYNDDLLKETEAALVSLREFSKDYDVLFVVGAPLRYNGKIYNTAPIIYHGEILAVYAKRYLPHHREYYESRQFNEYHGINTTITIGDKQCLFGNRFILQNTLHYKMCIGVEICEDMWAVNTPSSEEALNGANIILNLSASNEVIGKGEFREQLISATSARLISGYIFSSCGASESTTDILFSGYKGIYENGDLLEESPYFDDGLIVSDIDIERLENERMHSSSFVNEYGVNVDVIPFRMKLNNSTLNRKISQNPFIFDETTYEKVIHMQALGLKKRLEATKTENVVVGLSGGLDSALALIVCTETMKLMNLPLTNVHAIILPAFGTSDRTLNNAINLAKEIEVTYQIVDIKNSVTSHLKDIGHDLTTQDVTYENAQARERTQVLFDMANKVHGIVVGTGDLSELCLGWTTFNADHMSNYSVNISIPKTLVKELVNYYAKNHPTCSDTLNDILLTPISPELTKEGESIDQLTEDKIGPYELNDFFIYYYLRHNYSLKKILFLAVDVFVDKYTPEFIKSCLVNFIKRFHSNQFKRSTLPDGIKISEVSVSPRGDLRLPSDMSVDTLLSELD